MPRDKWSGGGDGSPGWVLEREDELAALAAAARQAAAGSGCVVLISGEADIGKSSLIEVLGSQLPPENRLLVGYCHDLSTRRTLGSFRDLAGSVGTEFAEAVQDATDRDRVLAALRNELAWTHQPTVLAVEDVIGPMRPLWTRCTTWSAASPTCRRSLYSPTGTTS